MTKETLEQKIQNWLAKYERAMQNNGINTSATNWIALGTGAAVIVAVVSFFVISLLGVESPALLAAVCFFLIIDLSLGYPMALDMQRINKIEEAFPNVLKQLADTLKAGGTYEFGLREITESDYGPITREIKLVLRRMEEGQNLDKSLQLMSENIDSRLVKRTLTIIIDALKSGGGLSEILDDIADDMRSLHRIQIERKSKTTMQMLFLVTAGAVVGPAIMGFTTTVLEFLITTAANTQAIQQAVIDQSLQAKQIITFLLALYIVIEVIAASLLLGLMRDGQAKKSIIYIPILLFVGMFLFYASKIVTKLILHY